MGRRSVTGTQAGREQMRALATALSFAEHEGPENVVCVALQVPAREQKAPVGSGQAPDVANEFGQNPSFSELQTPICKTGIGLEKLQKPSQRSSSWRKDWLA